MNREETKPSSRQHPEGERCGIESCPGTFRRVPGTEFVSKAAGMAGVRLRCDADRHDSAAFWTIKSA